MKTGGLWRRKWVRVTAAAVALPTVLVCLALGYYYVVFAREIDARLHGERQRVLPRIFARPLELRRGQSMSERQLVDRLNDLGYTERAKAEKPGEFAQANNAVTIAPRTADMRGHTARVVYARTTPARGRTPARAPDRIDHVELDGKVAPDDRLTLDAPVLTSMVASEREKRRPVALSAISPLVVQAFLSIEDRRYYYHPGVDPIRLVGAVLQSAIRGKRISATSTITQQLVRNVFLPQFNGWTLKAAREREGFQGKSRKAFEIFLAFVLDTRASKDEILEMYLNDMPLGQRGSFSIFGVAEASRLFFGKDVSNVTLAEAATMAGVLQSPSALSPFTNPERCRERRNVVLQAMVDAGYVEQAKADAAAKEPLVVVQRALEAEAPHFVDYVAKTLEETYPGLTTTANQAVDVYTTLDLHLQHVAQDAMRDGLTNVDKLLSGRRRKGKAEAALIAIDPKTGEILAMVGGRSYNQSQYNRALVSRRQPGSVFKPFVYLTAFEQAAKQGRTDITPASIVDDSPKTWEYDGQIWSPENYGDEYDGLTTYRHALANSRNLAAAKVAEQAGYQNIVALWSSIGIGTAPKPYPSIALGVFEATPFEIATAYSIFPNHGVVVPLRNILNVRSGTADVTKKNNAKQKVVAQPDTTYLVTNMMRSVINEGTAASARTAGFTLDAAGKTGTTNDLRDAWFVGFTPDLLTVVWVGFDDNQPVGLTGAQAALPIWTTFMMRALAGRPDVSFDVPDGVTFADIDPLNGKLASPRCPAVVHESFLAGTEPTEVCPLHRAD
jgi:penicillin-binding protein 1B